MGSPGTRTSTTGTAISSLDYYLSLFTDRRALNWQNLYNYGAAFDMVAAVLNRFSPLGVYETRHLLNAAIGIVGLLGCWKLGRVLGGRAPASSPLCSCC